MKNKIHFNSHFNPMKNKHETVVIRNYDCPDTINEDEDKFCPIYQKKKPTTLQFQLIVTNNSKNHFL